MLNAIGQKSMMMLQPLRKSTHTKYPKCATQTHTQFMRTAKEIQLHDKCVLILKDNQ